MNIIESIDSLKKKAGEDGVDDFFLTMEDELEKSLHMFWEKAGKIIDGTSIKLQEPPNGYYNLENNFFSALFIYSYYRAGIENEKRILYSAMNQCFRGMVTGCDNLLDDEYKRTLETNLPGKGTRFRSILDIMVSDRVFFELSIEAFRDGKRVIEASEISLRALVESGYQEATEEGGIDEILPPDEVLKTIHHYKTGMLFTCPWAIPSIIETIDEDKTKSLNQALYNIGIGCQIMDDMADLERDIKTKHHNYVVSLIYHDYGPDYLTAILSGDNSDEEVNILLQLKDVRNKVTETARSYLMDGLNDLFEKRHRVLVEPAIRFLSKRISVSKYFQDYLDEN